MPYILKPLLGVVLAVGSLIPVQGSRPLGTPDPALSIGPNVLLSPGGALEYKVVINGTAGPVPNALVELQDFAREAVDRQSRPQPSNLRERPRIAYVSRDVQGEVNVRQSEHADAIGAALSASRGVRWLQLLPNRGPPDRKPHTEACRGQPLRYRLPPSSGKP